MKHSTLLTTVVGWALAAAVPLAYAQSAGAPSDSTGQSAAAPDSHAGDGQDRRDARDHHDWRDQNRDHHDWQQDRDQRADQHWQHQGDYDRQPGGDRQSQHGRPDAGGYPVAQTGSAEVPIPQKPVGQSSVAQNQHLLNADVSKDREAMANTEQTIRTDRSDIRTDRGDIQQDRGDVRTDRHDLRHDYAERRDGVQDQRSIFNQRTDIRAEAKDIHQDESNLRSTEQNLQAQRDQLHEKRQDLRKDEGALRTDDRGDLRFASSGDLRSGQDLRVANNHFHDAADQGNRAWSARASGQEVWRQMTATNLANQAAANQKKSVTTQQLQQKWYRYMW